MYRPGHFDVEGVAAIHDMIDASPFVHLVTPGPDGLVASELPMLLDRDRGELGTLVGHLARGNPHWRALPAAAASLAIVPGPDAYISPSTYASKATDPNVVPTWNYAVVHATGQLVAIDDGEWLRSLVTRLTDRFEADRAEPWQVTDAPAEHIERLLRAIVGVELRITTLEGKRKLSQNRPAADIASAAQALLDGSPPGSSVGAMMLDG